MLKDYTTIKSKKCSIEKFLNLDLAIHNSQVVKYADNNEDVCWSWENGDWLTDRGMSDVIARRLETPLLDELMSFLRTSIYTHTRSQSQLLS